MKTYTQQELSIEKQKVDKKLRAIKAKLANISWNLPKKDTDGLDKINPAYQKLRDEFDKVKNAYNAKVKATNDAIAKELGFKDCKEAKRIARANEKKALADITKNIIRPAMKSGKTTKVTDHVSITFTGFGEDKDEAKDKAKANSLFENFKKKLLVIDEEAKKDIFGDAS